MNLKRISIVLVILAVIAAIGTSAYAAKADDDSRRKLVGTWVCDIPGDPGFHALQTYNADGTVTETSSLLGEKQEGPAHGVWSRDGNLYRVTFQLFAFDPATGESTGMIRVRLSLRLESANKLTATYGFADLIDLNGNITELGGGPDAQTCTRMKVVPVP